LFVTGETEGFQIDFEWANMWQTEPGQYRKENSSTLQKFSCRKLQNCGNISAFPWKDLNQEGLPPFRDLKRVSPKYEAELLLSRLRHKVHCHRRFFSPFLFLPF
jgi:hypothetical protein